MTVDGILNVNKPAGWTSFDVVAFVRRHSGVKRSDGRPSGRVGHAGTLDPAAEGVLVVCLGKATRAAEYLLDARKSYRARIRLGVVTDTYDADGSTVREGDASLVTREMLEEALQAFRGVIDQVPPLVSAIKRDGVPLYKHARAGREVEREARRVEVYRLELVDYAPPVATVDVECGRGFYVRSLAYDLGERLGCGAHLEALVRVAVGPFDVESAVGIDTLRHEFDDGTWRERLLPVDTILEHWHAAILGEENVGSVVSGRALDLESASRPVARSLPEGAPCRAYSLDGELVALLRHSEGAIWQPIKVLAGPKTSPEAQI